MRILSVVHSEDAGTSLFRPAGHELEEWSFPARGAPPEGGWDAYLVFGGAMHADQERRHPWLREELEWLRGLLRRGAPVLGVCLGAQLLARAAGAPVGPLEDGPEIGWCEVERLVADPVLGVLPRRFEAFEWHHYTYGLPEGAVELARSERATQAFRLGEACWAVQFHPEVTHEQVLAWIDDPSDPPADPVALRQETAAKIGRWNELGRALRDAFVAAAGRR
ncbi:MAG TPA: type 1 glutamine amidotransferase [Gaiellaceae bacterium]|nr:type 1 glutamine amidotransferase [Gaiellaceae bacterium]